MDPVVVNANEYALHSDFIDDVYAHRFGSMTLRRYSDMVLDHENDEFFSGDLLELIDADGTTAWGFTVWDNAALEQATVTEAEVRRGGRGAQGGGGRRRRWRRRRGGSRRVDAEEEVGRRESRT